MGTFPPSNPPSGGANSTIQVPEPSAPPRSVIIAPPPTMAEAAEIVRRLSQPQLPMVPLLPSWGYIIRSSGTLSKKAVRKGPCPS